MLSPAQLFIFFKRKRTVIAKRRVITMFDVYAKVVKNGIGVFNALVKIAYNGVELSKYTDENGLAVFEDIPSNITKLDITVDLTEAWVRELRLIEDWEQEFYATIRITEDWEELFSRQLRITEDWEEVFVVELRITEDWEEIFTVELRITEDWEIYFVNQLVITEDWES